MMDTDDIFGALMIIIIIGGFLISTALFIIDGIFIYPHRAQDALDQCIERGYDSYSDYSGFMRTEAYGVKCNHINNKQEVVTDSDVTGVIVNGG